MNKKNVLGLLSLGMMIGAFGSAIVLLYTPVGATVREVLVIDDEAGASGASDDAVDDGGIVVEESPVTVFSDDTSDDLLEGALVIHEEGSRRIIGGVPMQVARVRWPASLDARHVLASSPLRKTSQTLYSRVVPDRINNTATLASRNAAIAFIALGPAGVDSRDPCIAIGAGERGALLDAYVRTQSALPETVTDYQFACSLVTDPENAIDITKRFPDHRRIDLEPYALRTFTRFFGRLPSQDARGNKLSQEMTDKDWWAIKYLTYFPVLASAKRDLAKERACITAFTNADLDFYKGDALVKKKEGEKPDDLWDWSFVRACAYSGAPFLEQFASR